MRMEGWGKWMPRAAAHSIGNAAAAAAAAAPWMQALPQPTLLSILTLSVYRQSWLSSGAASLVTLLAVSRNGMSMGFKQ